MAQKLNCIIAGFIAKIGKYSLGAVGSLCHGGPYAVITLKGVRIGWVSFKTKQMYGYNPRHKEFTDAKKQVDIWFQNEANYNLAAKGWNDMNLGVYVNLAEVKNERP